jgi:hypothetical protein
MRPIKPGQTVREVTETIAKPDGVDVDQLSLDGSRLAPDEIFGGYFQSPDKVFTVSKSLRPADLPSSPDRRLHPAPPLGRLHRMVLPLQNLLLPGLRQPLRFAVPMPWLMLISRNRAVRFPALRRRAHGLRLESGTSGR